MKIRQRAFTVIELMVVIVLILILAEIVVSAIGKVTLTSRQGQSVARLQALSRALQIYRDEWGDVPPYNPEGRDYDGDGQPDPAGPGLWALVMLDYLTDYRYLHDPASGNEAPWITGPGGDRASKISVIPGDSSSMAKAYEAHYGAITPPGRDLTAREEWLVYNLLARPADHARTAPEIDFGDYSDYDDEQDENWCSWMMQDPYSGEWKYLPVRATEPPGGSSSFAVADPSEPFYYHRQLSHVWTDLDSPRYLPASDTVVTWASLYRQDDRRKRPDGDVWGYDLVLYADGHVESAPGPAADVGTDALEARATLLPAPR